MDATLKAVFPFGQIRDRDRAALQDSGLGDLEVGKAGGTLRNCLFSGSIESGHESATEMHDFGEGMRLSPLIDHAQSRPLLNPDLIGFEVPAGIRRTGRRLGKQIVEGGEPAQADVLAEIRSQGGVEGGRITLVQGHNLGGGGCMLRLGRRLRKSEGCTSQRKTTGKYGELRYVIHG